MVLEEAQAIADSVFPREMFGRTFHTAEEIESFIKEVKTIGKAVVKESKGIKQGRAKSAKRQLSESVIVFLNENYDITDELMDALQEKNGNMVPLSFKFNTGDGGSFYYPVQAPKTKE